MTHGNVEGGGRIGPFDLGARILATAPCTGTRRRLRQRWPPMIRSRSDSAGMSTNQSLVAASSSMHERKDRCAAELLDRSRAGGVDCVEDCWLGLERHAVALLRLR